MSLTTHLGCRMSTSILQGCLCACWIMSAWNLQSGVATANFCGAESDFPASGTPCIESCSHIPWKLRLWHNSNTSSFPSVCNKTHTTWLPGDPRHIETETCLPHLLLIKFCCLEFFLLLLFIAFHHCKLNFSQKIFVWKTSLDARLLSTRNRGQKLKVQSPLKQVLMTCAVPWHCQEFLLLQNSGT